jgi:hypothetical protein
MAIKKMLPWLDVETGNEKFKTAAAKPDVPASPDTNTN